MRVAIGAAVAAGAFLVTPVAAQTPPGAATAAAGARTASLAPPVAARGPSAPGEVTVRASADRTAVWVGDRLTYTVEITCRRGTDVLDDDLSPDKLRLDGLQLVGSETTREDARDGTAVHRVRYVLAAYRVDVPSVRVAPLAVRTYVKRPGQRLEDAAPAGEVHVPGAVIAFRSVLADDPESDVLRDGRPAARRAAGFAAAQSVGIGLIVASIAPVVFGVLTLARRRSRRVAHRSVRQVKHEERASLDSVRLLDLASPEARVEALARIEVLIRHHLREVCGVEGPSLTPDEVGPALAARGARVPADVVASLLAACELGRYAPADKRPSEEACREAIGQAERVLEAR
jgi:hypothetical protein